MEFVESFRELEVYKLSRQLLMSVTNHQLPLTTYQPPLTSH